MVGEITQPPVTDTVKYFAFKKQILTQETYIFNTIIIQKNVFREVKEIKFKDNKMRLKKFKLHIPSDDQ